MSKKLMAMIVGGLMLIGLVVAVTMSKSTVEEAAPAPQPPSTSQAPQAQGDSEESSATEVKIEIKGFAFNPKAITVKKGTKVTWTNQDSARHDVVSDDGGPAGGPSGQLLAKGESYTFTFNTVGTFAYHCSPHPYMKGTVTVTE